jgi:hypothetical protein
LVWIEESLFSLYDKVAGLVGWEEVWFGLDGKSYGIGCTLRVFYEKRSGYTAVWLVLGD